MHNSKNIRIRPGKNIFLSLPAIGRCVEKIGPSVQVEYYFWG